MSDSPIFFEFDEERSAYLALDTLHELGYRPNFVSGTEKPTLHIHIEKQDLTSALEIAQAYGGRMIELEDKAPSEEEAYAVAYDLDEGIRIPAHVVAEDFPEDYAHPQAEAGDASGTLIDDANAFHGAFDPSGDTYDGFSAGVRL
ncbi:hypothetical protein ACFFK0_03875 [Paenibacillus chartarius]|uniref:Heat induced stress protein YflT n=1 Tax=Paenibacillus chartarius TaxID=747481 RepID=A0ABV6DG28_9BACL